MSKTRRIAAIDIGTVTTRLLVADVGDSGLSEVARSTDITHLGEGLSATGRLSDAAMQRVADVIVRYTTTMRELGVESFSAMATSASRDAENSAAFLEQLAAHGVTPLVIPGEREARLSFAGATSDMDAEEDLLVVDLGGGSTELIAGDVVEEGGVRRTEIVKARSIDVGSKRVTERFLHSDPPTAAEIAEAREWTVGQLRPYFDGLRDRPQLMVSLAGTATTLSAIRQELEVYDPALVHCSCLTGSELADLVEMLSAMSLAERVKVPGLDPGRATVIVAGALILETIVALAGLDSTVVSEHDILYGILLETYDDLREEQSGAEKAPGAL
jgi:exopolyphosphatase/guanosine-5'-triphosphate,3'-diphosphate pyrophosphatase